jgi:hypothetical protein
VIETISKTHATSFVMKPNPHHTTVTLVVRARCQSHDLKPENGFFLSIKRKEQ